MTPPTDADVQLRQQQVGPPRLPEYPTASDLAEFTGTPASTWRYWSMRGEGPPSFKIGRRRVWRRAAVLAWLEAQEAASA